MKYNNLNYIDYNYLQGSNDPWICVSCCNKIFPFGILTNKNLSMMMVNFSPTTVKKNAANNINSNSSLALKLSANLSLLFNQFNKFSTEQKHQLENVVNSNYYEIDQFQTSKIP